MVIIALFLFVKKYFGEYYAVWMEKIYDRNVLVYLVFSASEVFFGIIPPELFMIWAIKNGNTSAYIGHVTLFALLSYFAGVLGFYIGQKFSKTQLYINFKNKFAVQFERNVKRFGGYMLVVAALTPIPYSAVCMIAGAANFKTSDFLMVGISRFARFAVYAFIVWQVNKI